MSPPIEICTPNAVFAVSFTADGDYLVAGDANGEIRRWRIRDGTQQGPTMKAAGIVDALVVSSDGRWIVSGDRGNSATIWNAATHTRTVQFTEHAAWVCGVDVSRDSTRVVSAGDTNDSTVRIFNITSGLRTLPPMVHPHSVIAVKYSPDGKRIATATYRRNTVRVYDANSSQLLFDIPVQVQSWQCTPLVWSPDGQQLFVVSPGRVTCLNISTSSTSEWSIHSNDDHASLVTNGRFIACSAGSSVSFWDPVSRTQIDVARSIQHTAQISCIAISSDETYLACGFGGNIAIHNLRDILPPRYFNTFIPLMHVSDKALAPWTQANLNNAETILSGEITSSSSPAYHLLANRSLVRGRLNQSTLAFEDATQSLQVQSSPIGHIAMAVALFQQGDRDGAEWMFNLAFHDCEPCDLSLLLLLQAILAFECGKQDTAIARIEYLITRTNTAAYVENQVLGGMFMKRGEYARAISHFDRAGQVAPTDSRSPLVTVFLIFGWTFDELDTNARRRLYEDSFTAGHFDRAAEVLLSIIQSSSVKQTADWVVDFHRGRSAEPLCAENHSGSMVYFPK